MADRDKGLDVADLVTTAFEAGGAAAVAVGAGWQVAVVAGGPAGLMVGGLGGVVASWVFTGGPARARAYWAARKTARAAAAKRLQVVQPVDGPAVVPDLSEPVEPARVSA